MMPRISIFLGIVVSLVVSNDGRTEENPDLRLLPPIAEEATQIGTSAPDGMSVAPASAAEPADAVLEVTESTDVTADVELSDDRSWRYWISPSSWCLPEIWESSFEVGIDASEGNTSTLSFRTGANLKRKVDWSDLKININYVKASAEGIENKHNAQLDVNHDWLFGESPWSLFGKTELDYDEFTAFDVRLVANAGLGYRFLNTDTTQLKGRLGTGASHEFGGPDDRWVPEAVFGADFEHKISKRQKFRATADYLPEWGDFHDYRLRTDVAWELLLDQETNMSLKLGIIDRYDSTPNGLKPNNLDYSLLLLWKL